MPSKIKINISLLYLNILDNLKITQSMYEHIFLDIIVTIIY